MQTHRDWNFKTLFRVAFPRFPIPGVGAVANLYAQLRHFEKLAVADQRSMQSRQLDALLEHARHYSPFWQDRIGNAQHLALETLPVLTRSEVQAHFSLMRARSNEMNESLIEVTSTSGSTGHPVSVERIKPIYEPLYHASTLVEHRWHGRDQTRRLGIIRSGITTERAANWGAPFVWFGPTGPRFSFDSTGASVDRVLHVMMRTCPDYLVINAPLAASLAREALSSKVRNVRIEQVLAYGGPVTTEDRMLIKAAFGSTVVNRYTSEECGYIAIQCPRHPHYHVLSGTVLVEIVDERGKACPVGEPGRVLVTSLHSYAMPLIRYDIGDVAEWGDSCDCGITLPVIRHILGRSWRLIRRPDNKRILARIDAANLQKVKGLLEWRFVVYTDHVIGVYVRSSRSLTSGDKATIRQAVRNNLGYPYEIAVHRVNRIEWMHEWKREDFAVADRPYRLRRNGRQYAAAVTLPLGDER